MEAVELPNKDSARSWRQSDLESKSQHSQEAGFVCPREKTCLFLHPGISSAEVVLRDVF